MERIMRNTFKVNLRALPWAMALLLSAVAAGCGGGGGGGGSGTVGAGAGTGVGGLGSGPAPVDLKSILTNNFVILTQAGATSTGAPPSSITGNIGTSPAAGTSTTVACAEMQAGGKIFDVDGSHGGGCASIGTADKITVDQAVLDMGTAYADANARTPDYTELGAGNIGGLTLGPATYKWGTGVLIPTNVTLSGGPNDVWIFQIAQGLSVASGVQIILAGGALPQNIYWATFAAADLGTTAKFKGNVLSKTSIAMKTGTTINGRLLAQTAVTLDATTVAP
jgi:hypothetical protein